MRILIWPSVLVALVCCVNKPANVVSTHNTTPHSAPAISETKKFDIAKTQGVVVLNKFENGDFVKFYNADGSLWYEFTYFYDDKDGKFEYANDDFRPFAFHQDYFLLVLKCTDINDKFFEVVVNEETELKKYVKANDPVFKFEAWEKLVLSVHAIEFDQQANPILKTPNGQRKRVIVPTDARFEPAEIKGDWLRVRFNSEKDQAADMQPDADGWIRWKNKETLLIELYYFA